MSEFERQIKELEDRNSELAKEILLNESALYEAQKEMSSIDTDLLYHPEILNYFSTLRVLIERIEKRNELYRREIFENEWRIQKLKSDGED